MFSVSIAKKNSDSRNYQWSGMAKNSMEKPALGPKTAQFCSWPTERKFEDTFQSSKRRQKRSSISRSHPAFSKDNPQMRWQKAWCGGRKKTETTIRLFSFPERMLESEFFRKAKLWDEGKGKEKKTFVNLNNKLDWILLINHQQVNFCFAKM